MTRRAGNRMRAAALLCVWTFAASGPGAAAEAGAIPDFSGMWQHGIPQIVFHAVPGGGPGPVIDVQDIPCTPNCPPRPAGRVFIGDPSNPNLTARGAAAVRTMGERWRSGEIVNVATELCAPSGVPHIVTVLGPVQILQMPDFVTILYHRDHQVRFVYLNRPHSENLKPSWYGESVGHYEGDTLVVDTIGLNDKSLIDRFGAPQTEKTHVVERYRLINNGAALLAHVTVDDPEIFVAPWSGTITFNRGNADVGLREDRCAENNRDVAGGLLPIPMARDDEPRY